MTKSQKVGLFHGSHAQSLKSLAKHGGHDKVKVIASATFKAAS